MKLPEQLISSLQSCTIYDQDQVSLMTRDCPDITDERRAQMCRDCDTLLLEVCRRWNEHIRLRERVESLTADVATNAAAAAMLARITNEIDCRIEHGAESGGHLEAIMEILKDGA